MFLVLLFLLSEFLHVSSDPPVFLFHTKIILFVLSSLWSVLLFCGMDYYLDSESVIESCP